jgi:nucleotide-binding universal stress UspA family protein
VTVVHAYQIPVYTLVPEGAFLPSAEMAAAIQDAAQRELDALTARKRVGDVRFDAHLKNGSPAEAVLESIAERGADLVVMGSHGGGVIERALLGGVASKVVRASPVPVITVRGTRVEPASAPPPPA